MLFGQKEQNLLLKDALKHVIGQVFRTNISYDLELHVEGTLGVTVDQQKSFVFHFDDKLDASQNKDLFSSEFLGRSDYSNSVMNYLTEPANLQMNLPSTPLTSETSIITEVQGFDPVEADPQLEVEVESVTVTAEPIEHSPDQVSPKMMRNMMPDNKFDPMISAFVISDSDDDLPFSPPNFDMRSHKRKTQKSFHRLPQKRLPCKDSKESVFKKINRLKKKTVIFSKKMSDPPLDSFDVESNLSNFSFECSVDGGIDSKVDLRSKSESSRSEVCKQMNVCEACGLELKSISQLEGHLVSKHGITDSLSLGKITSFSCSVCHKSYRFQAQLVKHLLRHEVKKPFVCKICKNSYRCKESLNLHMQVHNTTIDLNCHICLKSYSNKILFQKHIAYMHEKVMDDKV